MTSRLADRAASWIERRTDRRGFLSRTAVAGSALAVAPARWALRPVSAYAAVCQCGPGCACGARCCEGYTEFCCTLTGDNACPAGTALGGWWKADGSGLCGGGPRYYFDCNVLPGHNPCSCGCGGGNCSNWASCCSRFRYGQCHQEIPVMGPIMCRVVSCAPPWDVDPTCTAAAVTDNSTRLHDRACAHQPAIGTLGPSIIRHPDGAAELFVRGIDHALWTRRFARASGWGAWEKLGGLLTSEPDAAAHPAAGVAVVARGTDGAVWCRRRLPDGQWRDWFNLGGLITSAPSVVLAGDGRMDVFVRGIDAAVWQRTVAADGQWLAWSGLGGQITSAPDAAVREDGRLDVMARGVDDQLWWRNSIEGGWSPWTALNGVLTSGPAVVSIEAESLDVFVRGTDRAIWGRSLREGAWSSWYGLGGGLVGDPDVGAVGDVTTLTFRGLDDAVWLGSRLDDVWLGWESTGRPV